MAFGLVYLMLIRVLSRRCRPDALATRSTSGPDPDGPVGAENGVTVAPYMSMCRSHAVTAFSAPTRRERSQSELDGKSDGAEKIFVYLERHGITREEAVTPRLVPARRG